MLKLACRARTLFGLRRSRRIGSSHRTPTVCLLAIACAWSAPSFTQTLARARVPVACEDKPSCGDDPSLRKVLKRHKALVLAGTQLRANIEFNRCDESEADTWNWGSAAAMPGGDAAVDRLLLEATSGTPTDGGREPDQLKEAYA